MIVCIAAAGHDNMQTTILITTNSNNSKDNSNNHDDVKEATDIVICVLHNNTIGQQNFSNPLVTTLDSDSQWTLPLQAVTRVSQIHSFLGSLTHLFSRSVTK